MQYNNIIFLFLFATYPKIVQKIFKVFPNLSDFLEVSMLLRIILLEFVLEESLYGSEINSAESSYNAVTLLCIDRKISYSWFLYTACIDVFLKAQISEEMLYILCRCWKKKILLDNRDFWQYHFRLNLHLET